MSGHVLHNEAGTELNANESFTVNQILAITLGVGFGIGAIFAIVLGGLYLHYWKGGIFSLIKVNFQKRPTTPISIIPMVTNNTTHFTSPPSIDRNCKPRKMSQEPVNTQNDLSQASIIVQDSSSSEAENKTGLDNSSKSLSKNVLQVLGEYCNVVTYEDADNFRDSVVIYAVFGRSVKS